MHNIDISLSLTERERKRDRSFQNFWASGKSCGDFLKIWEMWFVSLDKAFTFAHLLWILFKLKIMWPPANIWKMSKKFHFDSSCNSVPCVWRCSSCWYPQTFRDNLWICHTRSQHCQMMGKTFSIWQYWHYWQAL